MLALIERFLRLFRAQPQQLQSPPRPTLTGRAARPGFPRRLSNSELRAYMRQRRRARDAAPTATAVDDLPATAVFDGEAFGQLLESNAPAWTGAGGESGGAGASGSWDSPTYDSDCSSPSSD